MKQEYEVKLKRTYVKTVYVTAESYDEAEEMVDGTDKFNPLIDWDIYYDDCNIEETGCVVDD